MQQRTLERLGQGGRATAARRPGGVALGRGGWLALLAAATALALAFGPQVLSLYWLRLLSYVFMFGVLAQGLNLIAGFTGYPALGNVVFFGLGAYGSAITMSTYGGSLAAGIAVGVVVAMAFAAALGPALLRLRGHYFAVATVGLNEAIKAVVTGLRDVTGGGMGLAVPLPPGGPRDITTFFYYVLLGLLVVSVLLVWRFSTSRLGHACRAVRDNELKAEAMGVHTVRAKTTAWVMSAALTAATGAVYAYWMSYIEPPTVFSMAIAVKSFVILLLGGGGTVLGPVIGAFFIELVTTFAWKHLLEWHLGLLGLIIVAVIIFMPNGFARFVRDQWPAGRRLWASARRRGPLPP